MNPISQSPQNPERTSAHPEYELLENISEKMLPDQILVQHKHRGC